MRVWMGGLAVAAAAWAAPGKAEPAFYDVTLKGVKVAELRLDGEVTGEAYTVEVTIRSDGLAGLVRKVRFQSSSAGSVGPGFVPARYIENADTGRRQSEVEMVYQSGVPEVRRYISPREDGPERLDPAAQGGTLDPATALYAGLRDLAEGEGCAQSFEVFDGRRRSGYTMAGTGDLCTGTYRRIAGYTAEEMEERSTFPIELVYAAAGPGRRVIEASVQTIYGKVRLKRR